jgi:two-component system NtrC family sensor kinase
MTLHDSHDPSTVINAEAAVQSALDGLENRFRDLEIQITALQRLASLGTVSAMIAHEFNNLLTPIISYSQYALQKDDPALLRTAVEKSLKSAQRLTSFSEKILGLAADQSMGAVSTSLRPLIDDALACLVRDLSKDSITLTVDVPDDLMIHVHPASLQQVIFNLVLNARQAMLDRPGRLTLSARKADDRSIELDISDTGCGIKASDLPKLFEPFYSTKRHAPREDRGGVGLGLHICKRLMTEQHGDIRVSSRPGAGTTFTLVIPIGETAASAR